MLITASPGPDNLMVLGFGISRGRAQGIAFGLGCGLGCLSHTLLAVLGVSALIAASPAAFAALKVGGGLYLIWLGVQALRSRGKAMPITAQGGKIMKRAMGKPGKRSLACLPRARITSYNVCYTKLLRFFAVPGHALKAFLNACARLFHFLDGRDTSRKIARQIGFHGGATVAMHLDMRCFHRAIAVEVREARPALALVVPVAKAAGGVGGDLLRLLFVV